MVVVVPRELALENVGHAVLADLHREQRYKARLTR